MALPGRAILITLRTARAVKSCQISRSEGYGLETSEAGLKWDLGPSQEALFHESGRVAWWQSAWAVEPGSIRSLRALPLRSFLGAAPKLPGSQFLIRDQVLVSQLVERVADLPFSELLLYARHRANSSTGIFKFNLNFRQPHEADVVRIFILQMRKLRLSDVKQYV